MSIRDLLIVGAGPSGLAAAIAAKREGLDCAVVEKGVLVDAIFRFPVHMVFFTTPELLEIGGLPLITPYDKPTRLEALRYYRRVVDIFGLQVSFHERVIDIEREDDVFVVTTEDSRVEADLSASAEGSGATSPKRSEGGEVRQRRVRRARAVILAIGYYDNPNYLGIPGEDLPHVAHYYTDAHPYYRQRVVVVGGKNSAAEAALELFRGGAHVTLVHRHPVLGDTIKYWVRPDIENRIKEGSVTAHFSTRVVEITRMGVVVEPVSEAAAGDVPPSPGAGSGQAAAGPRREIPCDAVFLLTGYKPDVELMRRAGVNCDPVTLAPELNPETFETNVPNLFIAGGAIAGRNTGSIFIENGRFHGERVVKVLAERFRNE
jgi:thioredoxin reductase (NADPH)